MYVATLTLVWWWQIILIRSGGGVNFFVQFLLQYTQTENVPIYLFYFEIFNVYVCSRFSAMLESYRLYGEY